MSRGDQELLRAHMSRAMIEIKRLRAAMMWIRDSIDHEDAQTIARETLEDLDHDVKEAWAAWERGEP